MDVSVTDSGLELKLIPTPFAVYIYADFAERE
jgi:hypothetical protein